MKKSELKALSESTFPTNGVKSIVAANHRTFNGDLIDSLYVNPGSVVAWAGLSANIPDGWHVCDGTKLSQTDYPELFAALGSNLSPWGVQTANSTFSIPSLPAMSSPVQTLTDANLSKSGGEQTHQLSIDEMPRHTHYTNWVIYGENGAVNNHLANGGTDVEGTTMKLPTEYTGGDNSHNNMQPYVQMYWIIKIY